MEFLTEEKTQPSGLQFHSNESVPTKQAEYKAEMVQVALADTAPVEVDSVKNYLSLSGDDSVYRESLRAKDEADLETMRGQLMDEALQIGDKQQYIDATFMEPVKLARDVETILEEEYGKKVLNTVEQVFGNKILDRAESDFAAYDGARGLAENTLFNQTIGKELLSAYEEEDTGNPLGDIYDFSITAFLPFYQGADLANAVVDPGFESRFFEFTGNNVQRQIEYIQGIEDKAERKRVLKETLDNISSLDDKQQFLQHWLLNSDYQANMTSLFTDATDVFTLGTSRSLKAIYSGITRGLLSKDAMRGVSEAAGEGGAAVAASLARNADPALDLASREAGQVLDVLPSLYNDPRILTGTETLTGGAQRAIHDHMTAGLRETIEKLSSQATGAQRMSPLDLLEDVNGTLDELKHDFGGIRILDVAPERSLEYVPPTNTYRANIFIGNKDGSAFATKGQAEAYAQDFVGIKTKDYKIVQDQASQNWVIKVERDVDEQKGFLKSLQGAPIEADEKFSTSFASKVFGRLLSTSSSEGKGLQGAKLTAVHGAQDWWTTFRNIAEPYFNLRKDEAGELLNVFEHLQKRKDINSGLNPGWYDSVEDFELGFYMLNGKGPSDAQHAAYWAYRQAMDTEKALMETSRLATYIRLGARKIGLKARAKDGKLRDYNISASPVADKQKFAEEWRGRTARMAVVDEKGNVKYTNTKHGVADDVIFDDNYDIFWAVEKQGAKVAGKNYNFIALPKTQYTKANLTLEDTSAGYAGGHHLIHENPYFVKIGNFDAENIYSGDRVLVNAFSQEQANRIADNWNEATRLFLEGDQAGARLLVEGSDTVVEGSDTVKAKLPFISWDDFVESMKGAATDIKAVGARAGTSWLDNLPNKEALGARLTPDDRLNRLADYERAFSESRTAPEIRIMREEANGEWKVESAPTMNPTDALQTSLNKAISARMVKDSLVRGVRSWSKQFSKQTTWSPERIYSDPIGFITARPEDVYTKAAYRNVLDGQFSNAEQARNALARQVETGTATSRFSSWVNDKVHEKLFGKGQKPLKAFEWARTKDPIAFSRSVAYDFYLGLWNIQQVAVQMSSTAVAASIAPTVYPAGIAAAMALKATMYNSSGAIAKHFGKHFSKFTGLTADEFAQMSKDLRTRGWSHMGGTMAQIADDVTGSIVEGKVGKALEMGRIIPQSIDRFHRHTGWAMAWIEAKKKLGKTNFSATELEQILARANTLSQNMSSANNAAWQRGAFAPAAQFTTYPLRVMEEVLGGLTGKGNLSRKEAVRVLAGQALLFGVPSGVLGTAIGPVSPVNFKETFISTAIDHGFNPSEGALEAFNDGLLSTLTEYFTGEDVDFERLSLGSGGILEKYWEEGMSFGFLTGPGGAAIGDLGSAIFKAMRNATYAETGSDVYELLQDDLEIAARQIASVDVGFRLRDIIQRQVWTNRKGEEQAKVGEIEGVMTVLAGAKPADVTMANTLRGIMYDQKLSDGEIRKNLVEFYARGLRAKNPDDRRRFFAIAKHYGYGQGLTPKDLDNAIRTAQKNEGITSEQMIDRFNIDSQMANQRWNLIKKEGE